MSDVIDVHKGRIVQKSTYYAFEIYNDILEAWQEFVIREDEQELKNILTTPLLDENGQIRTDESEENITAVYPYYYEEIV